MWIEHPSKGQPPATPPPTPKEPLSVKRILKKILHITFSLLFIVAVILAFVILVMKSFDTSPTRSLLYKFPKTALLEIDVISEQCLRIDESGFISNKPDTKTGLNVVTIKHNATYQCNKVFDWAATRTQLEKTLTGK